MVWLVALLMPCVALGQTGEGQTGEGQTGEGQIGEGQIGEGQIGEGQIADEHASEDVPEVSDRVGVVLTAPDLGVEGESALAEFAVLLVGDRFPEGEILDAAALNRALGDESIASCAARTACLHRAEVELGLSEWISVEVSVRGDRARLALVRVDVARTAVMNRLERECQNEAGVLVAMLETTMNGLFAAGGDGVGLADPTVGDERGGESRAGDPGAGHAASSPSSERSSPSSERSSPSSQPSSAPSSDALPASGPELPVLTIGSAVVAVLALGFAVGLGIASSAEPDYGTISMREAHESFFPAREREATAANILFGVAGGALIAATIGLVLPSSSSSANASEAGLALRHSFTF